MGRARSRRDLVAADRAADDAIYAAEIDLLIRAELVHLPEGQRTAFELVKHDGLTIAEAAESMGTTVGAVRLRIHKTYVALRVSLGDIVRSSFRAATLL